MKRNPPKTFADHIRSRVRQLHTVLVAVQANLSDAGPRASLARAQAAEGEVAALALEQDLIEVFALTRPAPLRRYGKGGSDAVQDKAEAAQTEKVK